MDSQFYNAYSTLSEFCGYPTPAVVTSCRPVLGGAMRGTNCSEEDLIRIFYDNNGAASFDDVSPDSGISSCAMGGAAMFPELLGFSEDPVATDAVSEYSHLGLNGLAGLNQSFGGGDSYIQPYNKGNNTRDQFGDQECCTGFMPADSKPLGQENWGFNKGNHSNQAPTTEDHSTVAVRYSEEERKERIERYLKKRNQRNFNKTIKYACRKTLADRRVRVRGRFASNSSSTEQLISKDLTHQEMPSKKFDTNCNIHACNVDGPDQLFRSGGAIEIKYDEEEYWLQVAMSLLVDRDLIHMCS
ncbi:hypothetical protein M0R45_036783 [Rubus argutus]|uniref:CCT domain-containing protein n=1 Tax=Rubus argutus TaxID=59490 RepID=A0AAW1W0W7_RUBAR